MFISTIVIGHNPRTLLHVLIQIHVADSPVFISIMERRKIVVIFIIIIIINIIIINLLNGEMQKKRQGAYLMIRDYFALNFFIETYVVGAH